MKLIPLAAAAACSIAMGSVQAQDAWPSKPIKFIVSYSAGGTADQIARAVGNQLARELKQPIVVDNRPGASGMIGGSACKAAAPDGYSFCVFLSDVVAVNPALFKKVPYNPETDFVPVALLAEHIQALVTSSKSGVKDVKGFADRARQHPGSTNWGSWGVGSSGHLLLSIIEKTTQTQITHVPYVNTPALITAALTNEVTGTIAGYGLVAGYIEQQTMRPIAVMGTKRLSFLPDVPTLEEAGIPMRATLWYGLFAPTGTPPKIVADMNAAVNKAVQAAVAAKSLDLKTVSTRSDTQPQFAEFVSRESQVWRDVVVRSGIKLD